MKIMTLTVGQLSANCYLLIDDFTSETIIIDPGDDAEFISTTIQENRLVPKLIILTHGHYDHCLGVLELKLNYSLPIYLHQEDNSIYEKSYKSSEFWSKNTPIRHCEERSDAAISRQSNPNQIKNLYKLSPPPINHFIKDQEIITLGENKIKVIHTPGHTPGSICLFSSLRDSYANQSNPAPDISDPILFTGDTLFADSIGDTSHQYSSKPDLRKSLAKISKLPSITTIYPGHGGSVSLKEAFLDI